LRFISGGLGLALVDLRGDAPAVLGRTNTGVATHDGGACVHLLGDDRALVAGGLGLAFLKVDRTRDDAEREEIASKPLAYKAEKRGAFGYIPPLSLRRRVQNQYGFGPRCVRRRSWSSGAWQLPTSLY